MTKSNKGMEGKILIYSNKYLGMKIIKTSN